MAMLVRFMKLIASANISSVSGLKIKTAFQTMQEKMRKEVNCKEERNMKDVHVFGLSTACVPIPSHQISP